MPSDHREIEEMAESMTPEDYANLEAAKQMRRERWHKRLARLLGRRTRDDAADSEGS
jgi:hypothetical protein